MGRSQRDHHTTVGLGLPVPLRKLQEVAGQPDGGRIGTELRAPAVGLPQPLGDRAHHGTRHLGMICYEGPEDLRGHHGDRNVLQCHHRRRAGLAVDDRHLADQVSGATVSKQRFVATFSDSHDLHPPRSNHHCPVGAITLLQQDVTIAIRSDHP